MITRTGILALLLVCSLAVPVFPQTQPVPPPPPPGQPQPTQPAPPEQPVPEIPAPVPPVVPAPPPTKIIPGASVAGLQLGSSVRALAARFGPPSEVIQRGGFAAYLYGRFGLVVYVRDDAVVAVSTTNSLLRLGGSLGVGYRVADARAEFGSASGQGTLEGFRAELYDDRGVGFGIDGVAIAAIIVFRPGTARDVSTL